MIKKDKRTELDLDISASLNKIDIRNYLLKKWSEEPEGKQFRYFVETLANQKRIYLERPANLNKGCDFVVKVEDWMVFKNGNDKPPKHSDLLEYITSKKATLMATTYESLIRDIKNIYDCQGITVNYIDEEHETILKLSKWLFIEQDITYWANSGRSMLWEAIKEL